MKMQRRECSERDIVTEGSSYLRYDKPIKHKGGIKDVSITYNEGKFSERSIRK